jgi:hypothetical protein
VKYFLEKRRVFKAGYSHKKTPREKEVRKPGRLLINGDKYAKCMNFR